MSKRKKKPELKVKWQPGDVWTTEDKTLFRKTREWIEFRNKIISQQKVCELCGYERRPTLHHIYMSDKAENYTDLRPERFKVLCGGCHKHLHRVSKSMQRKRDPIQPDPRFKVIIDEFIIVEDD